MTPTEEHPLRTIRRIAERNITVGDLAQRDLWRATGSLPAQQVWAHMEERNLDTAPLDEEPIRRFVTRDELAQAQADVLAGDLAHIIEIRHLITADIGLADGLDLLRDRTFLFVLERDSIGGIITHADLQRIPVTVVCLSTILATEIGLSALIQAYCAEDAWLTLLSDERRDKLEERYRRLQARNEDTNRMDCLTLADRLKIVGKIPQLHETLGYPSHEAFKSWVARLDDLRNDLAHGRTLLDSRPDALSALGLLSEVHEFGDRVWEAVAKPEEDGMEPQEVATTERLLLSMTLRDDYEVILRVRGYSVVVVDRHGTRHEDRISAETADWLREQLRGREVDKDQAAEALALAAPRLNLPFTYGFKLAYFTQKVLLVLVARNEATVRREGPRFIYTIQ